MIKLTFTGRTYGIKYTLKNLGFRWHPDTKAWYKFFNEDEKADAEELVNRWVAEGVYGKLEAIEGKKPAEKKYPVKESYIFNLEAIHDKVWCMIYDMREGKLVVPFEIAGKTINDEFDLSDIIEEAEELAYKAHCGVTGKEYGRIKQLVSWRVQQRYIACLNAGMDESDAGRCFEDM